MRSVAVLFVCSLAACSLSPEERVAYTKRTWQERAGPAEARAVAMEKAHARAQKETAEVPLLDMGERPAIELGFPANGALVSLDEPPLPHRIHALRSGNLLAIADTKDAIEQSVDFAIEELGKLRYLAVLRPAAVIPAQMLEKMEYEKGRLAKLYFVGGEARGEVLVFDLVDDALLGKLPVKAKSSAEIQGDYINPSDNFAIDLQKQLRRSAESSVSYYSKPNALRRSAHHVLTVGCNGCHDSAGPTAVPAAVAVFDLHEDDWAKRMTPAQLTATRKRVAEGVVPAKCKETLKPLETAPEDQENVLRYVDQQLAKR